MSKKSKPFVIIDNYFSDINLLLGYIWDLRMKCNQCKTNRIFNCMLDTNTGIVMRDKMRMWWRTHWQLQPSRAFTNSSILENKGFSLPNAQSQWLFFNSDPMPQQNCVKEGIHESNFPRPENKGKNGDLGNDDPIIGVAHKTIRTPHYEWRMG